MSIDRIIMLCIGIFGCVGLFYIGRELSHLNKTIYIIQDDIHHIRSDENTNRLSMNILHSMNNQLADILKKVAVGKGDVAEEEEC